MSDCVLDYMLKHKIPLTQHNYIELAYFGQKSSLEELEGDPFGKAAFGLLQGIYRSACVEMAAASCGRFYQSLVRFPDALLGILSGYCF